MDDRELDLSQRAADLAIRMRAPVQADLIQRKLFTVHYHIYASKDYLAQHPAPLRLEEVCNHTIIVYGETAAPEIRDINWLLDLFQKNFRPGCTGSVIRINNITGILQAVEAGLGIGVVPDFVAADHANLVPVLPEVPAPDFDVHLGLCRRAQANPSAWPRSATFWSRVPRTGSIEFQSFFRDLETPSRDTHFL